MDVNRLRDIEIDSGLRREDDGTKVHLALREADGLRRPLADVVLNAEQFMTLGRGGSARASGVVPREIVDGGDALVDALDRITSGDGKLSRRAPAEIAEMLLVLLNAGATALGGDRGRLPFDGHAAVRTALRSRTPRPLPRKG